MALTKATYSMVLGAPVNVLDYGADRTGASDSATAINTAITAVATAGGGTVYFPAGTYRTNTSIVLKDRVTLQGEGVPSRTDVAVSPTRILHYGNNPGLLAQTPTLIGEFSLQNLEFDGTNSGATASGLSMDAHTNGGAIVGSKVYDCTFCNFPNYQVLQNGTVFDNTFENCTFHNYDRTAGDCYHIGANGNPTQQSFINCFFINVTAGSWAFRNETASNPRFIGGTIGPSNIAANGISALGGLFIYGTHLEGLAGATGTGIFYKGSTGAFISPAECISFNIGILIGDGGSDTARGWTIAGCVGANVTYDVKITSGGPRAGTLCETGFIGGTRSIYDERATIDKVYEVSRVDASYPTFQSTFTPTIVGSTTAGSATYTIQDGLYQISGKILAYTIRVKWSGHTGTGNLLIGGFPNNADSKLSTATFRVEDVARTAATQLTGYIAGTSKLFNLEQMTAAGAISSVPMSAAGDITITGQYFLL
jgi:hypothetical protein